MLKELLKRAIDSRLYSEQELNSMLDSFVKSKKITINDYKELTGLDYKISLEEAKQIKLKEIWDECNKEILDGFYSYASGIKRFYGFDMMDQANFSQQLILITLNPNIDEIYWKTKGEDGVVLPYTKEQFMQIVNDAQQHKISKIQKQWSLKEQILNASTQEELNLLNWQVSENETSEI